jgi:hypothetical protein
MVEQDSDAELARKIREAAEDIGLDNLAKLLSLPPEIQSALLSAPREPKARRRSGGRPKGSGLDHSEALRKMARLLVANPEMKMRAAARQIAKEANVSWERLRHLYRSQREALEAEELARRKVPSAVPVPRRTIQPSQPAYGNITEELERFTAAYATQRGMLSQRILDLAAVSGIEGLPIAAFMEKATATSIAEQIAATSALSSLEDAIRTASKKTTDLLSDLFKESQMGQKLVGEFLTQSDWVRNQLLTQLGGSIIPPKK